MTLRRSAWILGVLAIGVLGLSANQTAGQVGLDAQYQAAIAAGAKPDVEKAGRLDAGNYRGEFRLRLGAKQYLAHPAPGLKVGLLSAAEAASQRDLTLWTAEPLGSGGYSRVLAKSKSYWSVSAYGERPTDVVFLRQIISSRDGASEEEEFLFVRVARDKALVRIRSIRGQKQGYVHEINGTLYANANKDMASLFIVE